MSDQPPTDDDGPVVKFPGLTRPAPDAPAFLAPVPYSACRHQGPGSSFEVDIAAGKCRCKACGGEVTPMHVLEELMRSESRWMRARATYQDQMRRLDKRSRTTCQHCGKMTRIKGS